MPYSCLGNFVYLCIFHIFLSKPFYLLMSPAVTPLPSAGGGGLFPQPCRSTGPQDRGKTARILRWCSAWADVGAGPQLGRSRRIRALCFSICECAGGSFIWGFFASVLAGPTLERHIRLVSFPRAWGSVRALGPFNFNLEGFLASRPG